MTRVHLLHLDAWTCGRQQTLALALALREEGWDARIVCRRGSPLHVAARARQLPVHTLPSRGIISPAVLWSFFRIFSGLPKDEPCLVQACDFSASRLAAFAARWKKNLRLAHVWRGSFDALAGRGSLRYCIPPAPVVADNEAGVKKLREAGIESVRVRMIPCGVNPVGYATRESRNDGRFVLAVTGSLTQDKGHAALFDAMALLALRQDLPPWELRVLGQGPLFLPLLAETESKGIAGRLSFLGGQNSSRQLAACDALALPAGEGENCLPLVLQGWASGVPIVAAQRPEYAGCLEDGVNCLTVPAHDRQALADALFRLSREDDLREKLRRGGHAALQRFSLTDMARAYAALYRDMLA